MRIAKGQIPGLAYYWACLALVAPLPLLFSDGAWYRASDGFFPPSILPDSTVWEALPVVGVAMVAAAAASAAFLICGLPRFRLDVPRFTIWRKAAIVLFVVTTAAVIAVAYYLLFPPQSLLGRNHGGDWELQPTKRVFAAGVPLLIGAFASALLAFARPNE